MANAEITPPIGMSINQPYTLMPLVPQSAFIIPLSDWEFLERKVGTIQSPGSFYNNLGWALVAAGCAALVAALTYPETVIVHGTRASTLSCGAGLMLEVVAALVLLVAREKRKILTCTKDGVLEDMKRIKERVCESKGDA